MGKQLNIFDVITDLEVSKNPTVKEIVSYLDDEKINSITDENGNVYILNESNKIMTWRNKRGEIFDRNNNLVDTM